MINLLKETQDAVLEAVGDLKHVAWVGSHNGKHAMSWEEFVKIANINYDNGYGSQQIASDLVVVFTGNRGWLYRYEYDGSEWWVHACQPHRARDSKPFTRVRRLKWEDSLAKLNDPEGVRA